MVSIRQARKDWAELKNGFLITEAAIAKVIGNKSWEPLGYQSFSEAWATELRDVTLAGEIRPHVAFYMFQEGYGPAWVAEHLTGVGNRRATEWHGEWTDGIPADGFNRGAIRDRLKDALGADDNETVVEPHIRKKPGKPAYIRFEVGSTWYREYTRIAKEMGTTVDEIARAATQDAFRSLLAQKKRRRRVA